MQNGSTKDSVLSSFVDRCVSGNKWTPFLARLGFAYNNMTFMYINGRFNHCKSGGKHERETCAGWEDLGFEGGGSTLDFTENENPPK